jgi:pyridoxamine 5'-phosphate oxidase
MRDISSRRFDYALDRLEAGDLDADPLRQFHAWLMDAADAGHREPNAMTLATADAGGRPAARIVLLRGVDERGFTWYTNRESPKGRDLVANPRAALLFYWERLERQVRVDGAVSVIPDDESAAYFAGRPRRSQLAAWASPQSQPLESRVELVSATEHYAIVHPDVVPRPPFWGGYRLLPGRYEFWQGRRDRLHDRFAYLPVEDGQPATTAPPVGTDEAPAMRWRIVRLAP